MRNRNYTYGAFTLQIGVEILRNRNFKIKSVE